ncbi:MAG: FAD-binding protein, partial [Proteobacteria bacterium]|nr:FAD-binding protein [Pseudomonadota bacterium]
MSYEQRQQCLAQKIRTNTGGDIRLAKQTSNLFRHRATQRAALDVSDFQHVLSVDPISHIIETEGI